MSAIPSATRPKNPQLVGKSIKKRNLENFDFSIKTRRQIASLKRKTGWTKKAVVETAVNFYHEQAA